jgi:WD40 repeat protein
VTGDVLLVGTASSAVVVVSSTLHCELHRFVVKPVSRVLSLAAFPSPHGVFVCGTDNGVQLLKLASEPQWSVSEAHPPLRGHSYFVNQVCFLDLSLGMASASSDGTVKLWKLPHYVRHTLLADTARAATTTVAATATTASAPPHTAAPETTTASATPVPASLTPSSVVVSPRHCHDARTLCLVCCRLLLPL